MTGELVEVDLPDGEEGVFAWLPIADPTHAMQEAQTQEDTRVAEEGEILAERYAHETARQHEEYLRSHRAAWEKRAEDMWWVMGGNSGMITAADPPFLPGVHHGLTAARRALETYLLRENRGLAPGSWIAANVCWNGYTSQAVALQEREGGPDEVIPA